MLLLVLVLRLLGVVEGVRLFVAVLLLG